MSPPAGNDQRIGDIRLGNGAQMTLAGVGRHVVLVATARPPAPVTALEAANRLCPQGHELVGMLVRPQEYMGQPGEFFECDICGMEDIQYGMP